MTLPPVACRRTVAVIGPKFGTASQAIDIAIRNHHGDENVESLWYEEAEFERKLGRLVGRVVRLITQALPLPQKVRSASEWFVGTMRFRRVDSVSGQLVFARSIAPIHHLVLVKPMFLRRRDLDELRLLSGATTVSIVLWDALWRTPSIRYLMSGVRVFSTEPTDCQTFGFTMLPVPTLAARELVLNDGPSEPFVGQGEGEPGLKPSNSEQPIRLFFCGSWSIDRWLAARRLVAAVRSLESGFANQASGESAGRHFICDLHLVTTNPLVACLTKSSSASSQPLSNAAYDKRVKQCDVLLDFGRKGQSSPSERLGMAARNGKLLLTTNSQLPSAGLPIVSIKEKGWIESLMSCERAIREGRAIRDLWEENASAAASVNTVEDWARVVFRSTSPKTSKPPTRLDKKFLNRPSVLPSRCRRYLNEFPFELRDPMHADTATTQSFLPAIGDRLLAFDLVQLSQTFKTASPFPHIVLDVNLDPALLLEFPNASWPQWDRYGDGHQKGKRICSKLSHIPAALRFMIEELHTSEVLTWLEALSGISALIPDPHLEGGGLHASEAGGILRTHTDFHNYRRLDVSRRLNLLVYLNDSWSSADGGALQLHRKGSKEPEVEVVPTFGRIVIFETSDRSPHGFMNPVAEGKTRQSVALYYYTARRTEGFDGDANTYWLGADNQGHRLRTGLANGFQTISRAAAVASHMADTNRGVRDLVDRRRNLRKP